MLKLRTAAPAPLAKAALLALCAAFAPARAMGIAEMEFSFRDAQGKELSATLAVVFPDTMAGTDTRALLSALAPGKAKPLLPGGRLTRDELNFAEGTRAFMDGNTQKAYEAWGKVENRASPGPLYACLRVDLTLLRAMGGELPAAESQWLAEWRRRSPAAEGAWRNLLGVLVAQGRLRDAEGLVDAVLRREPRQHAALLAKASLIHRTRSEGEWEAYLKAKAAPRDSLPEMQLAYGEALLAKKRYQEAARLLDMGLAALPGSGRGWRDLAEAQYKLGYYYYALDCLENANRAGYGDADFFELYARVLGACCTGDEDPRAVRARSAAQDLLEKGLPRDLSRRSMAQLLYHMYSQNGKSSAARELEKSLWFHFEGPREEKPPLGASEWARGGLADRALNIKPGIYSYTWMMALQRSDFYRDPALEPTL